MVLRSIGYKSEPFDPSVPFDSSKHVIESDRGKVDDGLYCSGWIKRGPTGIVGTNIIDAKESVSKIVDDVNGGRIGNGDHGVQTLESLLLSRGKEDFVTWEQWKKIDEVELATGASDHRPRTKIDDVDEMLRVAHA